MAQDRSELIQFGAPPHDARGAAPGAGAQRDVTARLERAEQAERAARTRAETIAGVAAALNAGVEIDEVLGAALHGCVLGLGGQDGAILQVDRASGLRCVAEMRPRGRVGARMPLDHAPLVARTLAERRPLWVAARGHGVGDRSWIEQAGGEAALATPMFDDGGCVGVIVVGFGAGARAPDADALALAGALADQCALAIARARVLADERRTRDRFAGLQRVTAELSAALTCEDVAVALREEGLAATRADVVIVMLRRGEELELLFSHGVPQEHLGELRTVPVEAELPPSVTARGRRPLFLAGVEEIERAFPALVQSRAAWADGAWAFVPLLAGGATIGVLGLAWESRRLPFDAEERGLVLTVAAHCALALERVRLAEAERSARAEAQRAAAEARAVAEVQEHLMAVVAHDLRSPLQAIAMGAASLLQHGALDARQASTATRISAAARRAAALISDLLDFGRARQGLGMRLAPAPADLGAICAAVVAELRELHPGRALSVASDGDVRGRWDPGRVAQLVQNLVTNALAHGGGAARVEVRVGADRDAVRLTVWNDGPPVPVDELPHLFGPLRHAGHAGGAHCGLGLLIVREIVLAHGGTIDVRSGAAAGTSFEIRLPRTTAVPS